jgi:hypothetical protein
MFQRLEADLFKYVRSPRHDDAFKAAQRQEPALAEWASLHDIVDALKTQRAPYAARDQMIRALVRMHRRDRKGPWSAALTVAFMPMLARLSGDIHLPIRTRADLKQVLLEGFLKALNRVDLGSIFHTALGLRQLTTVHAVRFTKNERKVDPLADGQNEEEEAETPHGKVDPFGLLEPGACVGVDAQLTWAAIEREARQRLTPDELALVVAHVGEERSFKDIERIDGSGTWTYFKGLRASMRTLVTLRNIGMRQRHFWRRTQAESGSHAAE